MHSNWLFMYYFVQCAGAVGTRKFLEASYVGRIIQNANWIITMETLRICGVRYKIMVVLEDAEKLF